MHIDAGAAVTLPEVVLLPTCYLFEETSVVPRGPARRAALTSSLETHLGTTLLLLLHEHLLVTFLLRRLATPLLKSGNLHNQCRTGVFYFQFCLVAILEMKKALA